MSNYDLFQEEIERICDAVQTQWKDPKDTNTFIKIAKDILESSDIHNLFSMDMIPAITKRSLENNTKQLYPNIGFSNYPITLVNNEHYVIDIYLWTERDTSLHSHHFTGAFKLLKGHSTQVVFQYDEHERLDDALTRGELKIIKTYNPGPGDVVEIHPYKEFIHHSFHKKSGAAANIVLRTQSFKDKCLSNYYLPGIEMYFDRQSVKLFNHKKFILENFEPNVCSDLFDCQNENDRYFISFYLLNNHMVKTADEDKQRIEKIYQHFKKDIPYLEHIMDAREKTGAYFIKTLLFNMQ